MKLMKHQQEAVDAVTTRKHKHCGEFDEPIGYSFGPSSYGLFWEMGTGKTATTISILHKRFSDVKALIITPKITLENWAEEVKVWHSGASTRIIKGTVHVKTHLLNHNLANYTIINYEALTSINVYGLLVKKGFDAIVCDESHRIKNAQAQRSKRVYMLAKAINPKLKMILTGTPILNSAQDLFGQFKFLAPDVLGKNLFQFRSNYMVDLNAQRRGMKNYFPNYILRQNKVEELNRHLTNHGSVVKKEDVLTLPELKEKRYYVELSPKQQRVYNDMKRFMVIPEDVDTNPITAANALVKSLRLQQIVSGHLPTEDKDKPVAYITPNPRIDLLKQIVEEILYEQKSLIVWTCFTADIQLIKTHLKDSVKCPIHVLEGKTKDKKGVQDKFKADAKMGPTVLIANRAAAGIGINLTEASHAITYSRNYNLADELQSEARNYRKGSEVHKHITKHLIIAKGTTDELTNKALGDKTKLSQSIVEHLRDETNSSQGKGGTMSAEGNVMANELGSIAILDGAVRQYHEIKTLISEQQKKLDNMKAAKEDMEKHIFSRLEEVGKSDWSVQGLCKVSLVNKKFYTVPKDTDTKDRLFHFLSEKFGVDFVRSYVSINSMAFNKIAKEDITDEFIQDFEKIVGEPFTKQSLSMRKVTAKGV